MGVPRATAASRPVEAVPSTLSQSHNSTTEKRESMRTMKGPGPVVGEVDSGGRVRMCPLAVDETIRVNGVRPELR